MLRHKDDWDEALEEAYWNAVARGDVQIPKKVSTPKDYDYSQSYTISRKELGLT